MSPFGLTWSSMSRQPDTTSAETTNRLGIVDAMRGLASIMVAWFHFTQGSALLSAGLLKSSGHYGWLGVEIFFVISGFILPWSLHRAGYRLRDYGMFLARRMVRLDPPYITAIALTLLLGYLSSITPGYRGGPFSVSWLQVLSHLGFLNAFFGYPWLSPVFWTLAIEFQYYLLVGLLLPLIVSRSASIRTCVSLAFLAAPFVFHSDRFMPRYACLFLLGISTFQFKAGITTRAAFLLTTLTACFGLFLTDGRIVASVASVAALVIAFVSLESRPLSLLGTLSYSLYLLHGPLGGRVMNAGVRLPHTLPLQCLVLGAAVTVSLASAYAFYVLIERPAHRWARALQFGRPMPKSWPAVAVAAGAGQPDAL